MRTIRCACGNDTVEAHITDTPYHCRCGRVYQVQYDLPSVYQVQYDLPTIVRRMDALEGQISSLQSLVNTLGEKLKAKEQGRGGW